MEIKKRLNWASYYVIIVRMFQEGPTPTKVMRVSALAGSSLLVAQRNIKNYVARFIPSRSFSKLLGPCFIYSQTKQNHLAMETAGKNAEVRSDANSEPAAGESAATENGKRKSDELDRREASGGGKRRRGAGGKKLRPGERYIPPPQKRNPGVSFNQEHFDEASYYFESGLRKVYPYYFDFKTYCKGRWIGKSLHEVFMKEFRAESIEYYEKAAEEDRIRLNETPVKDLSMVLRVSLITVYSHINCYCI